MKIAVTSAGPTLNDNVDERFGRCPYFVIIDTDTLGVEPIENPNISLGGGAGTQSAQLMAEKGVSDVLTGNCGPNAFKVFGAAGINVITGVTGKVRNAVEQFKSGSLSHSSEPNVRSHFGMGGGGMGRGLGMGMGGSMGRGMGRGGGMGRGQGFSRGLGDRGFALSIREQGGLPSDKNEIETLKNAAGNLRNQLEAIEAKLRVIEKK
jgi:predicted Fe-Mo cluster-binding NifX family protein